MLRKVKMIDNLNAYQNYFKYRYLLVDNLVALQDEYPLAKESLLSTFGADNITPIMRTDLSHEPHFCPALITVAEPARYFEQVILTNILEQTAMECFWAKRYICAVIVTHLAPKELAQKMITIGDKIAQVLQQPYYPFFEPFRMEFLHQLATAEDQRWLFAQFSGIDCYYYPSVHHGGLIEYSVDMDGEINQQWSPIYIEKLHKLRIIRTLVNAWANERSKRKSEQGLPLADDIIAQSTHWVEQAMGLGLTNSNDILFWGLNGLSFRIDFSQYPQALDLIRKAIKTPGTLADEFIATEQTIWNDIIAASAHHQHNN